MGETVAVMMVLLLLVVLLVTLQSEQSLCLTQRSFHPRHLPPKSRQDLLNEKEEV